MRLGVNVHSEGRAKIRRYKPHHSWSEAKGYTPIDYYWKRTLKPAGEDWKRQQGAEDVRLRKEEVEQQKKDESKKKDDGAKKDSDSEESDSEAEEEAKSEAKSDPKKQSKHLHQDPTEEFELAEDRDDSISG